MITIAIPGLRLKNVANAREHWSARKRRVKAERAQVLMAWILFGSPVVSPPARVLITRIAPRRMDSDGATIAAKSIRDELARCVFGVDDRDERIVWTVVQRRGAPREYGVTIEIARVEEVAA